jgi:HEAT repeat protein
VRLPRWPATTPCRLRHGNPSDPAFIAKEHTMNFRIRLLAAALALSFKVMAAPQADEGVPLTEPSRQLYWQGHEALGQGDWNVALERFRELEKQLAQSKTEPTDAAIYWQAYALSQAHRGREAKAEALRLIQAYPKSKWMDDADALAARETRREPNPGREVDREMRRKAQAEQDPREQDALMALDALLVGGNQKAVPMLQRVLAGDHTDRVKGRAMFVLSQIDPEAAAAAVDEIIRGNGSSRLKGEAIRMIAAGGSAKSMDRLVPLYRQTADKSVRRGILDAFLISDRADLLLQVIDAEPDAANRREAIQKLGAMGQVKELEKLYATRTDGGDRRAVLQALGIAGAGASLLQVARVEKDPQVRAEAIRAVGIVGGKTSGSDVLAFYAPGEPEEVREAVIQALMMIGATGELVQLYKKETDPTLRRELLSQITASDPDAALELIDQALQR